MARFINPFPQYINISGSPINGGFLKFFVTLTSTPKNVFGDSGLTQSIGNEVRLSGSGRVPALFLNGAYRVTLTDANGNELDSADPIGIDTDIVNFDEWQSTNTYNIPDVVKGVGSDDLYYQSIVDTNLNNTPGAGSAFWEQFYFLPTWNTAQTYNAGQLAIASDNRTYQSQVGSNTGNNPTSDSGTNWRILLQSNDTITAAGLIIDKIEAGSAGLSYVSASNQRWNWFFDTDESLKLNRFNSSGVLQDATLSFVNSTGIATFNNNVVVLGDGTFSRDGDGAEIRFDLTSDAAQIASVQFQDATVKRWEIGQNAANSFILTRYNASGADPQTPWFVLQNENDVQFNGNIEFVNTNQGFEVKSTSNSSMDFNFTGLTTNTATFDFFDNTTTTGTRLFNIHKGNVTNAITLQVIAETGTIHPSFDRAGETDAGVKLGKITLSSNAPTGGEDGDLWLRF